MYVCYTKLIIVVKRKKKNKIIIKKRKLYFPTNMKILKKEN